MNQFEVWVLTMALGFIKKDAEGIEDKLQPFIKQGETDIVALASKVSPFLGLVVQEAVAALGPEVPKYEGSAVAWLEATIQAWITKLGG
jgi:hypothetical protein